MTYENFQIHPLAKKFPLMKGAAFDDLVVSIEQRGLLEPIVMLNGQVVDGRNRLRACIQANVEPKFSEYSHIGIPVEEFIWTVNVDRRHLTDDQKAAASMAWEEFEQARAKQRQIAGLKHGQESPSAPIDADGDSTPYRGTRGALMQRAQVSYRKINDAITVKRHDAENGTDLLKQVETGDVPLRQAVRIVKNEEELKIVDRSAGSVSKRIERIREMAGQGYRAEQIAHDIGVQEGRVRHIARREGITLPDDKIGKSARVDVNRVIGETVMAAAALTSGLNLVDSRIAEIDRDQLPEWIDSLSSSIRELSALLKKLRTEAK